MPWWPPRTSCAHKVMTSHTVGSLLRLLVCVADCPLMQQAQSQLLQSMTENYVVYFEDQQPLLSHMTVGPGVLSHCPTCKQIARCTIRITWCPDPRLSHC